MRGKGNDFSRSFYPFEQFPGLDKAVEQEGQSGSNEQYREISGSNEEKSWKLPTRNLISLPWTNPSNLLQKYAGPPAGARWQETIMWCKPTPTMRPSANITFLINLEKSIAGTWHHKTLVWLAPSAQSWNLCHKVILNPRITFVSDDIADDTSASTYIQNIYALTHAHIPNEFKIPYRAVKL